MESPALARDNLDAVAAWASRHATVRRVTEGLSRPALEIRRGDGSRDTCYLGDRLVLADGRLEVRRPG